MLTLYNIVLRILHWALLDIGTTPRLFMTHVTHSIWKQPQYVCHNLVMGGTPGLYIYGPLPPPTIGAVTSIIPHLLLLENHFP